MATIGGEATGRESNAPVEITHGSNPEPVSGDGARRSEEDEDVPPYEEWTVSDLRAELVSRGLDPQGNKTNLISRLQDDDREEADKEKSEEGNTGDTESTK
jgi:hypothetical protein